MFYGACFGPRLDSAYGGGFNHGMGKEGTMHASPMRGAGTATGFKDKDKVMGQGFTKFLTDSERRTFRLLTGPRVDHLSRTDARDLVACVTWRCGI